MARVKVGFWNVQRIGKKANERQAYVIDRLKTWIKNHEPDVIILCEITQGGQTLADALSTAFKAYTVEYYATKNKNGGAGPCGFISIAKSAFDTSSSLHGSSSKRPYVQVEMENLTVAGCHVIANPDKAPDEVCDVVVDLSTAQVVNTIIIGDMNSEPESFDDSQKAMVGGWTTVSTGDFTHRKGGELDWAMLSPDLSEYQISNPFPLTRYGLRMVDHYPIMLEVGIDD